MPGSSQSSAAICSKISVKISATLHRKQSFYTVQGIKMAQRTWSMFSNTSSTDKFMFATKPCNLKGMFLLEN